MTPVEYVDLMIKSVMSLFGAGAAAHLGAALIRKV